MTAFRRFFADLSGAYRDGARVAAALPLLFGAIVAWEFAQHVIEYRIGFYRDAASAKAVSMDDARMALGWVKMALVHVGGFFTIRYLVLGDAAAALRPSGAAVLRYLPYVVYSLIAFALIFYADVLVPADRAKLLRGVVGLGQVAIEPLLMPWVVSAATDGPIRSPWRSARHIGRHYPWALALFFVGRIPINAAHQLLGRLAIGRPEALLWPMLMLDAIVVGLLISIMAALSVRIARGVTPAAGGRPH